MSGEEIDVSLLNMNGAESPIEFIRKKTHTVVVTRPGRGRYQGGDYVVSYRSFKDEKKARDYYTDCLVRYPDFKVELLKGE